jgi:hypothetical protein
MQLFEEQFHIGSNNVIVGEENRDVQPLNNRTIYYVDLTSNVSTNLAASLEVSPPEQSFSFQTTLLSLGIGLSAIFVYKMKVKKQNDADSLDRYVHLL